ncbi:MAG: lysophospholipid acyltransferase family protein [Ramlibacter sp.]
MPWLDRSDSGYAPRGAVAPGDWMRLHAGLALLALMCVLLTPLMVALGLLMRGKRRGRFARSTITWVFERHLRAMERIGAMRLDLGELDALRDAPAMIIAPNHPSMVDAALALSRLPNLTCIMKSDILDNVLFGSGARMAGYITSEPPRQMLRAATESLKAGRHLLLFPEGTRTGVLPVNRFQRTVGVIARRAGVPVQTVIIETGSAFLAKGWGPLRVPAMPMHYRVRLGRRFEAPADADAFSAELENYFRDELARARLPDIPVTDASS